MPAYPVIDVSATQMQQVASSGGHHQGVQRGQGIRFRPSGERTGRVRAFRAITATSLRTLQAGQKVSFRVVQGHERLQAEEMAA
jgi:hypothetical protein